MGLLCHVSFWSVQFSALWDCRQLDYLRSQLEECRTQLLQNTGQAESSVIIHRQAHLQSKFSTVTTKHRTVWLCCFCIGRRHFVHHRVYVWITRFLSDVFCFAVKFMTSSDDWFCLILFSFSLFVHCVRQNSSARSVCVMWRYVYCCAGYRIVLLGRFASAACELSPNLQLCMCPQSTADQPVTTASR